MELIAAVKANNLERVRLLVEQGCDKDKGNSYGSTPLYWASSNGHLNVAQYLVEQGAALDKADCDGFTPLIAATFNGHLEVCRYLLEQGADRAEAKTPFSFLQNLVLVCPSYKNYPFATFISLLIGAVRREEPVKIIYHRFNSSV